MIEKQEDGTWIAVCGQDGKDGHRCGGFTSSNHPTEESASQRLEEHLQEGV